MKNYMTEQDLNRLSELITEQGIMGLSESEETELAVLIALETITDIRRAA